MHSPWLPWLASIGYHFNGMDKSNNWFDLNVCDAQQHHEWARDKTTRSVLIKMNLIAVVSVTLPQAERRPAPFIGSLLIHAFCSFVILSLMWIRLINGYDLFFKPNHIWSVFTIDFFPYHLLSSTNLLYSAHFASNFRAQMWPQKVFALLL